MKWLDDVQARFWGGIALGLGIGLLGAYGREQNEGRSPGRRWLLIRLAVMPFLALACAAAADAFGLSNKVAGFIAALLALLGYDVVRVISTRALKRVDNTLADVLGPDQAATVKHGHGDETTVIVGDVPGTLGETLRKAIPPPKVRNPELMELLRQLGMDEPKGEPKDEPHE